ncbi:MAG: cytochrome c, partial [Alphaproteobacteria bacterium]
ERMIRFSTDDLKALILDGIPGTPMPPWRPLLSDAEAEWIARYLRGEDAS